MDGVAVEPVRASIKAPLVASERARPSGATLTGQRIEEPAGERRHVTVMFCDLVGSTSISAGLDAEDWRDLVGAYLGAASAAVNISSWPRGPVLKFVSNKHPHPNFAFPFALWVTRFHGCTIATR